MDYKNLFEKFNEGGKLLLPDATVTFDVIPWSKHPAFEGVELKHIITSERTDGQFSYHLVRIAPNKKIGSHLFAVIGFPHGLLSISWTCVICWHCSFQVNGLSLLFQHLQCRKRNTGKGGFLCRSSIKGVNLYLVFPL